MDNTLKDEKWLRRGHVRKPNFVVRSIYSIADWIGDFGPLFASTKRGVGHLSALAGHSLLLIVTLAITLLLVVTSAIHSFDLLNWIGFHGWTIYPSLIVVEAIFLTGSIQMDLALKKGVSLFGKYFKPSPPIFGFIVGLAFVLASNVMGLADNLGGLIFGIATPFLLIISKAMLAWQYTFRAKIATQTIEEKPPVLVDKIATENEEKNHAANTNKKGGENDIHSDHFTTENIEEKPNEITTETIEENHTVDTGENDDEETESTPEIATEKPPAESVGEIDEMEKIETTDEPAENKDESMIEEVAEEVAKQPTKTTTKKKVTKKKKTTVKVDDLTIENIALDYQKEHGELPGRKLLAQVAKCTEYRARNVLAKMEPSPPEKEHLNVENPAMILEEKTEMEKPKLQRVK